MGNDLCEYKYFIILEILVIFGVWIKLRVEGEICMSLFKSIVIYVRLGGGEVRKNGVCL